MEHFTHFYRFEQRSAKNPYCYVLTEVNDPDYTEVKSFAPKSRNLKALFPPVYAFVKNFGFSYDPHFSGKMVFQICQFKQCKYPCALVHVYFYPDRIDIKFLATSERF